LEHELPQIVDAEQLHTDMGRWGGGEKHTERREGEAGREEEKD
jgi:hypothetical protein